MKKFFTVSTKILLFFLGWAILGGLLPIPENVSPAVWRFFAELVPLLVIIAFTLLFYFIEKRKIKIPIFKNFGKGSLVGVVAGALWLGLSVGITYALGAVKFESKNSVLLLALWIFSAFLNVIMQELLVRGYMYSLIKSNYGIAAAAVFTTALFTAMHGGAFEAGVLPVLNVITMSLLMTALLEYTGSLTAPVIAHSLWNCVGALVFGCVSLASDYPNLLNPVFSGNILLSGGSCGLEGNAVVLILNIALTVIFTVMWFKKKRRLHKQSSDR